MEKIKNIFLAADHAGYELKEQVKRFLQEYKDENNFAFDIVDYGASELIPEDNYTDIMNVLGYELGLKLREGEADIAFVFGGSGQGEAMLMNRYGGVRAIVYYNHDLNIIRLGREHNNSNCISFGARFISFDQAKEAIELFLNTDFEGGRHIKRVNDLDLKYKPLK